MAFRHLTTVRVRADLLYMGIEQSYRAVRVIARRWRLVSLLGLNVAIIYWVVGQGVVALACLPGWDDRAMANTFAEHLVSARTFGVVLDEVNRHALFWFTIGFLVICFALWRWTNAALAKRVRMKVFIAVVAMVGGTMTTAGVITVINFNSQESCCGGSSLVSRLQTIRSMLELYQVQHDGQYPTLAQMWTNLVTETEADGSPGDGSGDEFGPYLSAAPQNHLLGGDSTIAADNSGAWEYDEKTGAIRAVVSPAHLRDYSHLNPSDVVAAPYEMVPGTNLRLTPARAFWYDLREGLKWCAAAIGRHAIVTAALIAGFAYWWFILLRRWTRGRDPLRCAAVIASIFACVALTGFLIARSRTMDYEIAAVPRAYFAAALLWAWSAVVLLQFRWDALRRRQDGSICGSCDYDLTGTRLAGRSACPECGAKIVSGDVAATIELQQLRAA